MKKKKVAVAGVGALLVAVLSVVTFGLIKRKKNKEVVEEDE